MGVGDRVEGGGQGGCERRIEDFVNIQFFFFWGGGGVGSEGVRGVGLEGGGGVRVDVTVEVKFL